MLITNFIEKWLPTKDLRRLVIVRGLRSFAQGYIIVIFAIYLSQIGFSNWLIGITLGIGSLVSAVITLFTGILSDKFGRKPFLILYSILLIFSGIVFSITTIPFVIIAVSALGGIGRSGGAGGQAGPFAPAETALLSEKTTVETRPKVFSFNNMVGTSATAVGGLIAGIPELLQRALHLSFLASYKPLFLSVAAIGALSLFVLLPITEIPRSNRPKTDGEKIKRKANFKIIWKFSVAGLLNGVGFGFIGGLLPYWLYLRFGVSPMLIGPVIGISSLLTAFTSLWIAPFARRFGEVNIISVSRLLGVLFTVLLAFSPTYPVAAFLVVIRMVSTMSAMPIRQSYTMGIIDEEFRGTAAGIGGVARRLPAAISPAISGYWLSLNELELPFFASALFSGMNAILYFVWFRKIQPKEVKGIPIGLPADS